MRITARTFSLRWLFIALMAFCLPIGAQTGPTVTLSYRGVIEGLPAVARIGFEDTRAGLNPGFVIVNGRPGWARKSVLIGRILLGGEVATPTAQYTFFGEVQSTSDFGYMDVTRTDGFERFRVRLDLTADDNVVYIDRFALVINPFDPPTITSYLFELEAQTQPAAPVLAPIANQALNLGGVLTFTAAATDANAPAESLTFSLDPGAPPGASIDANTGVFTWTPAATQPPGTYNITVRVTDNGSPPMSDAKTIMITLSGTPIELRVTAITLSREGVVRISWEGTPGLTCRLLSKTTLQATAATVVGQIAMTTGTASLEDTTGGGVAQKFYWIEQVTTGASR